MRRNQVLIGAILGVLVFYVLATISLGSLPATTDTGREVARWFREHKGNVRAWLWLTTFAMVFLGVFAAQVRRALPRPHADLFFAGVVTLIAETCVQGWILGGLALHPRRLQPGTARLALDIASFWGPVLIASTVMILSPIVVLAFRGEAGLPRWLGWLAAVALAEQILESITIFGTTGFTRPGGPMNLVVGALLTTVTLLAFGVAIASEPAQA